jgi:hypothetical protein
VSADELAAAVEKYGALPMPVPVGPEPLTAELPSRFHATPAQVDAYLRTILAEDTYLRFQQAIGEHALAETVEDAQTVRASADNDGLYNADWREGWDDAIERVDPDLCGPAPSKLIDLSGHDEPEGREPDVDGAGRTYESYYPERSVKASLREPEGEFYPFLHRDGRVSHDLPETGGPR